MSAPGLSTDAPGDRTQLLVHISNARWVGLAVMLTLAVAGRPGPIGAPWSVVVLAGAVAMYNAAVRFHDRLPWYTAGRMSQVTMAGDYLWLTAIALLLSNQPDTSVVVGYLVLILECGLLAGWRGAAGASAASVLGSLSWKLVGAHYYPSSAPIAQVLFLWCTYGVAAVFAGVITSEIAAQRSRLIEQAEVVAGHARTDPLTGTGNRLAFDEASVAISGSPFAVVALDVDGMQLTNDAYGYQAGDELLVAVGRLLAGVCLPGELAARLGGDMFVLLLPGADRDAAMEKAERVRAAAHGVAVARGQLRVSVGCAVGLAGADTTAVVALAEDGVLAAKRGGGDRVVAAVAPTENAGRWRLRGVVQEMLRDEQAVYSVYQRVVRLPDGATVGWEGLARPRDWRAAAEVEALFLTASEMGAGRDLDWRCRRSTLWNAARLDGNLFVNVDVAGLIDPIHGVDQMELLCEWAGRSPSSVVLELSERESTFDLERLRQSMAEYRAAGFRFALDDVGEGQTTLRLILVAQAEFLKLAKPLLQAAATERSSYAAARAMVGFAHDLGSTVIAEGVEGESELATCAQLGIDQGQGWLFGRPQHPTELRTR